MVAAEQGIEAMVAKKTAPERIHLKEIEGLALEAGGAMEAAIVAGLAAEGEAVRSASEAACPDCGEKMHDRGRRERRVVTEAGEATVVRA